MTVTGIDVSGWQGTIDWEKARTMVSFAFIKCFEREWVDAQFRRNWSEAKRVGIQRGAYLFYRANVDAGLQARRMIETLSGDYGELPLVVDLEDEEYAAPWDAAQVSDLQWCLDILEKFSGRRPIIYTARWWADPYLPNAPWISSYDLWVANYVDSPFGKPVMPAGWDAFAFWQWANNGIGSDYGVESKYVDLDVIGCGVATLTTTVDTIDTRDFEITITIQKRAKCPEVITSTKSYLPGLQV